MNWLLWVSLAVIAWGVLAVLHATGWKEDHPGQGLWCWLRSRWSRPKVWARYIVWQNIDTWDCLRCGMGDTRRHEGAPLRRQVAGDSR